MGKVGAKEAQRRAQRESAIIEAGGMATRIITPKEVLKRFPDAYVEADTSADQPYPSHAKQKRHMSWGAPKTPRRAPKTAQEGPKRIGRPPRLKKGDFDAVEAASREELAIALRYYRSHTAKNKIRNRA